MIYSPNLYSDDEIEDFFYWEILLDWLSAGWRQI